MPSRFSLDQLIERPGHWLLLAVLVGLVALIYANSLNGVWIFDDKPNIVDNPRMHLESLDWPSLAATFKGRFNEINRPLAYLSFGLNHYVHGLDVFGYHLVNLIIHALTAVVLYLLIWQLLRLPILAGRYAERAKTIAFIAVALWATSPMQVTAVTVIVQRMASMAALFFILAMLAYLMGRLAQRRGARIGWLALCVLSGALAVATKENALLLPVVLYLMELLLIQGVDRARLIRHARLAILPLALFVVLTLLLVDLSSVFSGYGARDFTLLERALTQPRVLLFYLSQMLYPTPERFLLIHDFPLSTSLWQPWTTVPAILFWLGWLGAGLLLAAKRPLIAFSLLFFLINHAIESSILPLEMVFEHRNYLPSMTLYLLLGIGIAALLRDFSPKPQVRAVVASALVVVIALQGVAVVYRNSLFHHEVRFWADNARKAPGLSRVHTNLGNAYQQIGLQEKARAAYEAARDANRFHRADLQSVPYNNIGNYHLRHGELAEAKANYQQALDIDPQRKTAIAGLSISLLVLGELDAAQPVLADGLKRYPQDTGLLTLNAVLQLRKGRYREAITEARKVLRLDPEPNNAFKVLGEAHMRLGELSEAKQFWQVFADANPGDLEAALALLEIADQQGDQAALRRAAEHLETLRKDRSWEDLFALIEQRNDMKLLLRTSPWELLPLIRRGLADQAG
jgi:Flp pilus assembly protein TadD